MQLDLVTCHLPLLLAFSCINCGSRLEDALFYFIFWRRRKRTLQMVTFLGALKSFLFNFLLLFFSETAIRWFYLSDYTFLTHIITISLETNISYRKRKEIILFAITFNTKTAKNYTDYSVRHFLSIHNLQRYWATDYHFFLNLEHVFTGKTFINITVVIKVFEEILWSITADFVLLAEMLWYIDGWDVLYLKKPILISKS